MKKRGKRTTRTTGKRKAIRRTKTRRRPTARQAAPRKKKTRKAPAKTRALTRQVAPRTRARAARARTGREDALRTPAEVAALIAAHANIALADRHTSGQPDEAYARQNIADTAAGRPAKRSAYGNAPGGTIALRAPLLDGILALADRYSFRVSEIAGGSHSATSRHYVGVAFDIDRLNGTAVDASNPNVAGVKQAIRDLGATEVLGPGDPDHDTHVHGAWKRS